MLFYVTFRTSSKYSNNFLTIEANSITEARDKIIKEFEFDYSFVWTDYQWKDYQGNTIDKRFNLKEIKYEDCFSEKG